MNKRYDRAANPEVFNAILVKYHFTEPALKESAGQDWDLLQSDLRQMVAFAEIVRTRLLREMGEIPSYYTSTTLCKHCGPVPTWPKCPPEVEGCVWCFNRIKKLPMPGTPNAV